MTIKAHLSTLALFSLLLPTSCNFMNNQSANPMKEYKEDTSQINNDLLKANAMAEVLNFKMNCFEAKSGEPSECLKFDNLAEKCKINDFSACKELLKKF